MTSKRRSNRHDAQNGAKSVHRSRLAESVERNLWRSTSRAGMGRTQTRLPPLKKRKAGRPERGSTRTAQFSVATYCQMNLLQALPAGANRVASVKCRVTHRIEGGFSTRRPRFTPVATSQFKHISRQTSTEINGSRRHQNFIHKKASGPPSGPARPLDLAAAGASRPDIARPHVAVSRSDGVIHECAEQTRWRRVLKASSAA